jgi:hypothetical protein
VSNSLTHTGEIDDPLPHCRRCNLQQMSSGQFLSTEICFR